MSLVWPSKLANARPCYIFGYNLSKEVAYLALCKQTSPPRPKADKRTSPQIWMGLLLSLTLSLSLSLYIYIYIFIYIYIYLDIFIFTF